MQGVGVGGAKRLGEGRGGWVNIEPAICNGHMPYTWDDVGGGDWEFDVRGWGGSEGVQNLLIRACRSLELPHRSL